MGASRSKIKKSWIVACVVVAGLLLPPLIVPMFVPWSAINCQQQDINIKTGQPRFSRSLWFIKVYERIADTPLSASLDGEKVDVADIKAWHRVNTFSPGLSNSPHYIFHGALHQVNEVGRLYELSFPDDDTKREIARSVLTIWQMKGSYRPADDYIRGLMEKELSKE